MSLPYVLFLAELLCPPVAPARLGLTCAQCATNMSNASSKRIVSPLGQTTASPALNVTRRSVMTYRVASPPTPLIERPAELRFA